MIYARSSANDLCDPRDFVVWELRVVMLLMRPEMPNGKRLVCDIDIGGAHELSASTLIPDNVK